MHLQRMPGHQQPTLPSTATPLPFVDSALVPTPTPYGESGDDLREVCQLAMDWHEYEIGESDNLLNIAVRVGSSIVELREGNCYEPLRGIFAGESLLVPALPPPQQEAAAPVFPDDGEEITAIGCESPSVQITSPQPLQEISGIFELHGNVDLGEASTLPGGSSSRLVGQVLALHQGSATGER